MNPIHTLTEPSKKCDYTVAVIDTDKTLNHLISQRLHDAGCTVIQAFSSDEIPALLSQHLDFIIVDPIYDECDEHHMCDYLDTPGSAGIIILTANPNHERRDKLFGYGILEFFYKEEPLEEIVEDLLNLFHTIDTNNDYHICMISESGPIQQRLMKLLSHRKYHHCFASSCHDVKEKWGKNAHTYPDLLVIDLKKAEFFKEAFEFIHYVRIHQMLEIPLIVLLDSDEHNLSPKLYRAGVNDVLVTPYSNEKLLSMITHHLDYRISKKQLKYEHSLQSAQSDD